MLNKKKIIAVIATGMIVVVCGVLVYVKFINNLPTYNYIPAPETTITEQQEVDVYEEIMSNIEVDAESSVIVNPTIDEDTGSMSGENSKGEFIQTPPLEIPESDEEMLRELLDNAGVPEEVTEQIVQESFPTEQVKPVEQTKPTQPSKPAETKPVTPSESSKPVENKPADPKPTESNGNNTWEGYVPGNGKIGDNSNVVEIKPGEGSGETNDTTIFK